MVYWYILLYYTMYHYFYSTTTTTSALPMRRPTGFHAPIHGPARVQYVLKEQKIVNCCDEVFPRSEVPMVVHTR